MAAGSEGRRADDRPAGDTDRVPPAGCSYLAIGHVLAPHGIRGEVKVELLTDFPERYRAGARVYLGPAPTSAHGAANSGEGEVSVARILTARPHKGCMLVKLSVTPDRTAAELLRGQYLLIPESEAMPLGEHENYAHDLVGLRVETAGGQFLGELTEILFTRANDVYVLKGPEGELLLPALREVVLSVDLSPSGRKMVVALPEGLLNPVSE